MSKALHRQGFFVIKGEKMRDIYDCVDAFVPLLDTEYELILGRKGVTVNLR